MINKIVLGQVYHYDYNRDNITLNCYLKFTKLNNKEYHYVVIKSNEKHTQTVEVVNKWLADLTPITDEEKLSLL